VRQPLGAVVAQSAPKTSREHSISNKPNDAGHGAEAVAQTAMELRPSEGPAPEADILAKTAAAKTTILESNAISTIYTTLQLLCLTSSLMLHTLSVQGDHRQRSDPKLQAFAVKPRPPHIDRSQNTSRSQRRSSRTTTISAKTTSRHQEQASQGSYARHRGGNMILESTDV
jgi:hypothetical protein